MHLSKYQKWSTNQLSIFPFEVQEQLKNISPGICLTFASSTNAPKLNCACTHTNTDISSEFKRKKGEIFPNKKENIL